ncbi:unnamed protein product [Vitrella brassicaformis CCMP3155]|uniref:Uncharacterized protein n=1 Tax=Vitrella brassicaformis (strain CCMP3155) TaxID=1169540 RepID=A0A0G4EHA1_VITBC|nr:unnamed protein product [Vitrella brassicaformis CCMP3155]|eukprot:CEL95357.1 unnamed protein product [Vitrella brassicaformis CCMP3155]
MNCRGSFERRDLRRLGSDAKPVSVRVVATFGCAVVVGVGPGLGQAVARRFARGGYKVALMSRDMNNLSPVKEAIEKEGIEPSIKEAFRTIRERLGDVEVLVWNAGGRTSWPPAKLVDTPTDQFETNMKVGCTGAFIASKEVVPAMTAQKKGTILLTGATASLRGGKSFYNLAVHKFALRALAQQPDRPIDSLLNPDAMAETYWSLHTQDKTAWSHEQEMRPYVEKW